MAVTTGVTAQWNTDRTQEAIRPGAMNTAQVAAATFRTATRPPLLPVVNTPAQTNAADDYGRYQPQPTQTLHPLFVKKPAPQARCLLIWIDNKPKRIEQKKDTGQTQEKEKIEKTDEWKLENDAFENTEIVKGLEMAEVKTNEDKIILNQSNRLWVGIAVVLGGIGFFVYGWTRKRF